MFSKCKFWLHKVQLLRDIVNHKSILVNPAKIEAVMRWEVPRMPSEIRSFLGWVVIIGGLSMISPRSMYH